MSLEKVLRLSGSQAASVSLEGPGDELRTLARAVHLALSEACQSGDPAHAAELIYAAAAVADDLNTVLCGDDLSDWVEATSVPDGTQVLLAGGTAAAAKPYGDVPYADPGYIGGRKRYPIDPSHVRAAWSYINQAKNASRYTAVQLSAIKSKIKAAMHKHGHGVNVEATASGDDRPVMAQLVDGEAWVMLAAAPASQQDIPMHHAPFNGMHAHAHTVTMTHGHEHSHSGDNSHGSAAHGTNAGQKAWAAKGEAGWARDRAEGTGRW